MKNIMKNYKFGYILSTLIVLCLNFLLRSIACSLMVDSISDTVLYIIAPFILTTISTIICVLLMHHLNNYDVSKRKKIYKRLKLCVLWLVLSIIILTLVMFLIGFFSSFNGLEAIGYVLICYIVMTIVLSIALLLSIPVLQLLFILLIRKVVDAKKS